jgi:PEP-CTERM motif
MTHLPRIAVLVGFLGTIAPAAWGSPGPVQGTLVPLATGNILNAFGLTATISGCSATCSGDTLELISSGRDTISIETINTATSGSAILASANSTGTAPAAVTLGYTLTFAINPSSKLTGTVVTSATQTAVGSDNCTGGCTTATGSAVLADSTAKTAPTITFSPSTSLTDNLTPTTLSNTVSIASGASTFSPAANAFTVTESLNLNGSATTTDLAFNTLVLKLNTAPEPASMSVMLIALGGLAAARRRRSS